MKCEIQSLLIALLFVALSPVPADAQVVVTDVLERPAPTPRRPVRRDVFRAYFHYEGTEMMAANTFDAVLGDTRLYSLGGGGEALNLWGGVFARVSYSQAKETGDRVVVSDTNEVLPVGIPLTIELRPLELGGGWRSRPGASGHLVGYLGGSVLWMRYRETSQFAGDEDNTDETFRGYGAFGGLEISFANWVIVGAEAQYRFVPDAIGTGGVSKVYGETNLGGATVRVLVGIRH